jgi:hypothetical protein
MRQSWSPRWRGHLCRPVAEQIPTLRLDQSLRTLLATAPQSTTRTISRTWYRGDLCIATCQISLACSANGVMVIQLHSQVGAVVMTETVVIDWVAQKLGGCRAWWLCPRCQRRCGVLFCATGAQWCCRICAKVSYTSSNASDRRITGILKSTNLAAALGVSRGSTAIGPLILRHKADVVIRRRARRAYRRWFRRAYPGRHLQRALRHSGPRGWEG